MRLVKLMGHASKQMVYEVYGNYVEGLEEDAEAIYDYFGQDFITPRKKENPIPFRYSTGHSPRVNGSILSTSLGFLWSGKQDSKQAN